MSGPGSSPPASELAPGPAIALTGATGFVGRHVTARLDELGQAHRALTRQAGHDLATATANDWAGALEGCPTCLHLGAVLPGRGSRDAEAIAQVNAAGTARLFEGFARAGGEHFVFLSTIGVNGIRTTGTPFRADDPPAPIGAYARSKAEAEARLQAAAGDAGVGLTILRPALVYGAGARGRFGQLVSLIGRAPVLPLGRISNRRDLIGVRNLADLIAEIVAGQVTGVFLPRDRETVSTSDLAALIARALGRGPRLLALPGVLQALMLRAPVARGAIAGLFGDLELDDADLARACRWRPRYSLAEEIARLSGNEDKIARAKLRECQHENSA